MSDLHGVGQPRSGSPVKSTTRTSPGARAVSSPLSRTAGLSSGQTITGKIVSISDDSRGHRTAEVDLSGRGTVQAKLQDGMGLKEGQTISFEVRGNSGRELTLSPLLENTAVDPTTLKALTAAGLPVTNDSVAMVREMMTAGMNVDRNSVLSMSYSVNSNPGADISTLVQLQKLNIPIIDENIRQFESYRNYEHQLLGTMNEIMDSLPEAVMGLMEKGDSSALTELFDGLIDQALYGAVTEGEIAENGDPAAQAEAEVTADSAALSEATAETISGDTAADPAIAGETGAQEAAPGASGGEGTTQTTEQAGLTGRDTVTASADGAQAMAVRDGSGDSAQISRPASSDDASVSQKIVFSDEELDEDYTEPAASRREPSEAQESEYRRPVFAGSGQQTMIPGSSFSGSFVNALREMGMKGEMIDRLISQASDGQDTEIDRDRLLSELSRNIHDPSHSSDEAGKITARLFKENDFNELLKGAMTDRMTMDPSQVADRENVQRFYRQLAEQTEKLTHTLTNTLGAESKPSQQANALSSGLDFMNQLNQMFNYVQLPIRTADGQAEGDLYVYANKKKKFRPGEPVSAVLHLDMTNMGAVDVFVQMTNNKVRTNFYVADEDVLDLIDAHIDELNSRLEKRGYKLSTRLALHSDMDDPSDNPAIDAMLDIRKEPVISFTSFDARA